MDEYREQIESATLLKLEVKGGCGDFIQTYCKPEPWPSGIT